MELMDKAVDVIRSMGASSLLPLTVVLLSICLGVKFGKAIRSGLMIGAGFVGINLIVEMMNSQLGTAAAKMSERLGLSLQVVDLGWQGVSPMAWASGIAAIGIPLAVFINILMLAFKMTRTVNIDLWNIWHMIFTGALAYTVTGKFWLGILGVVLHAAFVYKLGDLWAPFIGGYFELTGLTVPHGTSAYMAPVACLVDWIIDKIPGLRKVNFSIDQLQEKVGVLAEPVVIGGIMGTVIGLLAGERADKAFALGIQMSAVMILMPQIVKCIMEGLLPLSERAKKLLLSGEETSGGRFARFRHFGNGEFYIGLDPAVLLGDSQVVTAGLLFIPITLVIAMLMPGNQVLPFGDLATISFFIAISVAIHKGNLFRTLISGSLIMTMTLWITNQTIPWLTALAKATGTLTGDGLTAAMDQGGSPISYIYVECLLRDDLKGLAIIGGIYLICLIAAVKYAGREKQNNEKDIL